MRSFTSSPKLVTIAFLGALVFGVFSCKKDRLKDDKEILIGTWHWDYSIKRIQYSHSTFTDTTRSSFHPDTFSMEFTKKGKVIFYKNGEKTETDRLVFFEWDVPDNDGHHFGVKLNNNTETWFLGSFDNEHLSGSGDSLVIWNYFPFELDEDCDATTCDYKHFFIKEQ